MDYDFKALERYGRSVSDTVERGSALVCMASEKGNFYRIIRRQDEDCGQIYAELCRLLPGGVGL